MLSRRWWPILAVVLVGSGLLAVLSWPYTQGRAWSAAVGTAGDQRVVRSFWPPELNPEGIAFRRAQADSSLALHGIDQTHPLTAQLQMFGALEGGPLTVTLGISERPLIGIGMPAQWRQVMLVLPGKPTQRGIEPLTLNLHGATFRPATDDFRDLGVAVAQVKVAPLTNGGIPLHWSGVYIAWLLLLLFGAVVQLPGPRPLLWAGGALWLLLALGVVAWTWRAPYQASYLLAPAPWLLGGGTWALLTPFALRTLRRPAWQRHAASTGGMALSALVVCVLAQTALWLRQGVPGAVLAGIGLWLVGACCRPEPARVGGAGQRRRLWLGLILLLAAALRFYDLPNLPLGLWRDESRHGLISLRILQDPSYWPIYVAEQRVNMPAFTFYLFAAAVDLWGPTIWSMRLVVALAGTLAIVPCYLWGRRLLGERMALLAAALLACSSWHITISRFSFSTIFDPLFTLLALAALAYALDLRPDREGQLRQVGLRRGAAALAGGLLAGLAVHTYHTGRVVPVIVGLFVLGASWRMAWRPRLVIGGLAAVGLLVALLPLFVYAYQNRGAVNDRVSEVFLFSEATLANRAPLRMLDETVGRHLLMFNSLGERNGRHHAPNYPMVDWLTGLLLLLGLGAVLGHGRDWRGALLVVAVPLSLAPSLFAVDGPHGLRSIGAAAWVCYLAALGWDWMLVALRRRLPTNSLRWTTAAVVLVVVLLNVRVYFVSMRNNPAVWQTFYPIQTQIGVALQRLPASTTFIPAAIAHSDVLRYLLPDTPYQTYEEGTITRPLRHGDHVVLGGYDDPATAVPQFEQAHHVRLRLVSQGPPLPGLQRPAYWLYTIQG